MRLAAKVTGLLVLLYAAMQIGCWRSVLEARSPDRKHLVRIKEWCIPPDCGIKAELISTLWPIQMDQVSDGILSFAHIAWTPDGSMVAVLAVNGYGRDIQVAWDVRNGQQVAFERGQTLLADSIQQTYRLTDDQLRRYGNAVEWAIQNDEAHERFRASRR